MSLHLRIPVIIGLLLFLFNVSLQCLFFAPTIGFGDTGELVAAASSLGLTHPPGHPLFIFIAWIWLHLFVSESPGWILNLMSCAAGLGGFLLLSTIIQQISEMVNSHRPSPLISALCAAVFVSLPFVRLFGTSVEVYALQWLFLSAFILSYLKHAALPSLKSWTFVWLFLALAIATHPFSLFFAVIPVLHGALNRDELSPRYLGGFRRWPRSAWPFSISAYLGSRRVPMPFSGLMLRV